ncbi:tyrosine-protein kinase STYK1 isoform X2 [Nerophis ophidion]|uniref:tyrosine-protein kinase STYK1 isoform X2 n=1 Tax=Nerophis ophidion TaxID=159077 RepID=UPI002ADEFE92|nr:tyrosine-protein kinase STYK1 isoform X2 [Nerophis ophidion]
MLLCLLLSGTKYGQHGDTGVSACASFTNVLSSIPVVRTEQQAVIIVPTLLLLFTLITVLFMIVHSYLSRNRTRTTVPARYSSSVRRPERRLQGIDAPPGIDPLEHEELPMAVHKAQQRSRKAVPQVTTGGRIGSFQQVTVLPQTLYIKTNEMVGIYKARMDNRNVVLRALKDTANSDERQRFLDFASFVSGLGRHPFIPALLGVITASSPPVMVMEELRHRDLLGFLWRCRRGESACDMTERTVFTMATQVASALEYLHGQRCVHGNVAARSVLVGGDLTAKLWGLGSAYHRQAQVNVGGATELMKWQSPEVLTRRAFIASSDVWSFGTLLYEMVTLGDPPFAELPTTELLQQLQRGRRLKRPPSCSGSLFAIITSCCHWSPQRRVSVATLVEKLQAGQRSANGRTVIRVSEPLDTGKYLREAGYGEAYNYAVL